MDKPIQFPDWVPDRAVAMWRDWEKDHSAAYRQIPLELKEAMSEQRLGDVLAYREMIRDTKCMLYRLLTDLRMEPVWRRVCALNSCSRSAISVYELVFLSVCVRGYWGPLSKLDRMTRKDFGTWKKDVDTHTSALIDLIRGTDIESVIQDDLVTLGGKQEVMAGKLSEYLNRIRIALAQPTFELPLSRKYQPTVSLKKPNDKHAGRKFFACFLFDWSDDLYARRDAKEIVLQTTITAFELDDSSFEMRQIDRFLKDR